MSSLQDGLLKTASSLMALQLVSRLFTSALNQALIRLASPATLGAAAIQLELLLGTILFLSREGVRHALLRTPPKGAGTSPGSVASATAAKGTAGSASKTKKTAVSRADIASANLALVPLLLALPLTLVAAAGYERYAPAEVQVQPGFRSTVAIYALAALLELACEPMHNRSVIELQTSVRVRAEGLGVGAKSLVTFLILFYDSRLSNYPPGHLSLLAFAGGQMAYSIVLFVTYVYYFRASPPQFRLMKLRKTSVSKERKAPSEGRTKNYFDMTMLKLSMTLNGQFVLKHILTEGDKVVLSWYSPLAEQGGYAVAANYGSLVARLVFQPIEETSRVFFAKTLSTSDQKVDSQPRTSTNQPSSIPLASLKQASAFLSSILQTQLSLALPIIVFGHAYLPVILPFLLPPRYLATSAPQLLGAWVYYLPVLAVNGILEAFVAGTASTSDVVRQSRWMMLFSVIYIATAIGLYQANFGDVSLVYANIVGLSVRIIYAAIFVNNYFRQHASAVSSHASVKLLDRSSIMPHPYLLLTCAASQGIVIYSARRRGIAHLVAKAMVEGNKMVLVCKPVVVHVALGGILGLACLAMWWVCSGRHLEVFRLRGDRLRKKAQ